MMGRKKQHSIDDLLALYQQESQAAASLFTHQYELPSENESHKKETRYNELLQLCERLHALLPQGEIHSIPHDHTLPLDVEGKKYVAFVRKGRMGAEFRYEHMLEWVSSGVINPPQMYGAGRIDPQIGDIHMRLRTHSSMAEIELYPLNYFETLLTERQAWELAARILAYNISYMAMMFTMQFAGGAYQIIRGHLLHMSNRDFLFLRQYNVAALISKRTGLSKSTVTSVLSSLRQLGYIGLSRGRLVWIKALPSTLPVAY